MAHPQPKQVDLFEHEYDVAEAEYDAGAVAVKIVDVLDEE